VTPRDEPEEGGRNRLALLSLGALGVVYGDIGTSPLYALRESFRRGYGLAVDPANILGVLSLIFWALVMVVSVKYLLFVLRADNDGEGGILALTALVAPLRDEDVGSRRVLVLLGLFGAALLYGDGMITPAISVLSAVEGVGFVAPRLHVWVLPLTVAVMVGLFVFQKRGTGGVGSVFGPVMATWFLVLAILGVAHIVREPSVLRALDPRHAAAYFGRNGARGILVLGSVFLVVTGGEALYADLGHFGTRPIRLMWFVLVLPALVLNYFGQGALLMRDPTAVAGPFYRMAPGWATIPLVLLATAATIIASQAVISGSFSLAMQSMQLGYSPRLWVQHTSAEEIGQVFIPEINWALMLACVGLVVGFGSSSALAGAYGVAVTTTMVITTFLFYAVARRIWNWPFAAAAGVTAVFLVVDVAFWVANLVKIPNGGWFPLAAAGVVFVTMTTWHKGRAIVSGRLAEGEAKVGEFIASLQDDPPPRVPGTGVFLTFNPGGIPRALQQNLKHNQVLHERVVLLTVQTEDVPHVPYRERATVVERTMGFYNVLLHYGFMDRVDVPASLALLRDGDGLRVDPESTTYFLGRQRLVPTRQVPGMRLWREKLFAFLTRNARDAASFFNLPPDRVVEIGARVEL
jgi:KUP system potassium uptake protein